MPDLSKPPARGSLPHARAILIAIVTLLSLIGGLSTGLIALDADPSPPDPAVVASPSPVPAPPVKIDLDRSSDNEPAGDSIGAHEDLRDERPEGVPEKSLDDGLDQKTAPGITAPQPVGGAQNYRCANKFVVNRSDRNGQKPLLFVLHYTVSRPGSLLAIWRLFNTPSFSASSTFLLEFSGQCLRLMPDSGPRSKPWTQGNLNGRSISVEIIAMGSETRAQWLRAPIFRKRILAQLMVDTMRKNGIPRRWVDPAGCKVQQAGFTDHDALECGNSHTDVKPNFPYDVLKAQIADLERLTKSEASQRGDVCNKLQHHRRAFARERPGTKTWEERRARIKTLKARAVDLGLDDRKCRA